MGSYASEPTISGTFSDFNTRLAVLERGTARSRFLNISQSETRDAAVDGTGYGTLPTPDQHANVACPANSLLYVAYMATWKESVNNAAKAALFIGSSQTQTRQIPTSANAYTAISYAGLNPPPPADPTDPPDRFTTLSSAVTGLVSAQLPTGQAYGGSDPVFAHVQPFAVAVSVAGVYTMSVRFSVSSGTVTAKNRSLWVWGG